VAPKLRREELVTLAVLAKHGQSNGQIAEVLGVTEGAVRYHRRRQGRADGRRDKPAKAQAVAGIIAAFVQQTAAADGGSVMDRPINVRVLYERLCAEHGYGGSYKSVLRYVRSHYPAPKLRPYRRVETPPGAQAQLDWGTVTDVDVGAGPETLYAFVAVLSHSRKEAVIWRRRMDQLSWHDAHNEALRRLGGVPAVLRIDNLKTGIAHGAGPWGEINPAYLAYARAVGFHVDACLPRCPEHKGKVESKVRFIKRRLDLVGPFAGLLALQQATDAQLVRSDAQRICPATGQTVEASWRAEQRLLRPLPVMPAAFDVVATRRVQRDCTVNFEGRSYSVPFVLCGQTVEVHGCAETVQVWHDGQVVAQHPRHTEQRLLLEPAHYAGPGNDRVSAPVPLGKMGQRLQEIWEQPVEQRPVDLYAALAEVAR
jgi:transposase